MVMKRSGPQLQASQKGIPSLRGHDHTGITVADLEAAIRFFFDIVGCEFITRFGPFRDDSGSFMSDTLDVHPRAVVEQIALLRCGMGSNIELISYPQGMAYEAGAPTLLWSPKAPAA
jgi:catechol 2,3-dioxygenase-like lactoylglutathione lyase family enzyme